MPTKKTISIALLFVVLLVITACGNSGEQIASGETTGISTDELTLSDEEETEVQKPETADEKPTAGKEETTEGEQTAGEEAQADAEIPLTESDADDDAEGEEAETKMRLQIGDTTFTATLAENSSVDALKELMADGPLTLHMSDYANMEKGADLGVTLPQNNEQMNTQAGDIILYQGRTFVIYYDTNSWSLTPIGKIDDVDAEALRAALGTGDVTVTLSLE
ncbi:MAG: cyclophilin-like fold protein [Clostridium sp.]|nr:cyclophilin-like fold protein [Clostridium sp.]